MRSRVLAIVVAVVVPLAALGVVISRGGSSHKPARLPIAAAGGSRENAALGAAPADAALYPYGGIVYKAGPNLPALDGSARAYRVTGGVDADSVHRLTTALGLQGEATGNSKDGFSLEDGDSQFTAYPYAGGGWNYVRQASGGGVSSSSGVAVACPDTGDCPVPETTVPQHPADLPSQDDARAMALELLQRAGVDTQNVTVTVDDYITQWSVRVDPVVDGVPTENFATTVAIGENGVVEYAGGMLGRLERADEYPLIGTKAAIEKLNSGEGYYGGPRPLIAEDTAVASASGGGGVAGAEPPTIGSTGAEPGSVGPTEPAPLPPCDGVGAPTTFACSEVPPDTFVPPPPQEITLTGAEQVLLFAVGYDASDSFLVPAYRFTSGDGPGPTVLAIDDSFLAPPPDQLVDDGLKDGPVTIEPQPAPLPPQPTPNSEPATKEPSTGG